MWPQAGGQQCRSRWNGCRRESSLGKLRQRGKPSRSYDAEAAAGEGGPLQLRLCCLRLLGATPLGRGNERVVVDYERERPSHFAQACDGEPFWRIDFSRRRFRRIMPFFGNARAGFASNGLDWYTACDTLNASIRLPFAGARANDAARRSVISVSVSPHTRDTEASEALRPRRRPR